MPRSCDLTRLDYFLWGCVKAHVYTDKGDFSVLRFYKIYKIYEILYFIKNPYTLPVISIAHLFNCLYFAENCQNYNYSHQALPKRTSCHQKRKYDIIFIIIISGYYDYIPSNNIYVCSKGNDPTFIIQNRHYSSF